jgi:glycosyltransferase involved in cell wall biosynthesis
MKILHVIPSFAPAWRYGGPIFYAYGLARALATKGHEVTVMTTNIDGPSVLDVPVDRPVQMDGIEVQYFAVERPRWYCFSRAMAYALKQQVTRFDLVHIHTIFLWPTSIAAFWCRRQSVPYIVLPQGSLDPTCLAKSYDSRVASLRSRIMKGVYLRTLGKTDLDRASAIQFTAEAEMEAARPLGLKPPWFIVPLGVDSATDETGRDSLGLRERYPRLKGKKLILFLSRLDPKKGLDLLIPALGELASRREDFAFVVAGSGTQSYEAEVAASVRQHGLEDRTIFLGFVQGAAKWSLLREVDLFVLPSYQENFGVAVGEAMEAGVPVVISDRVNIHREVSRAGAGLVTGLEPTEIAGAIGRLLSDESLRREMGERGKRLVSERFAWDKVVQGVLLMYDQTLKQRPSPAGRAASLA